MILVSFASVVVFTVRWHEIFQPCFFLAKWQNVTEVGLARPYRSLKHDKIADLVKVT